MRNAKIEHVGNRLAQNCATATRLSIKLLAWASLLERQGDTEEGYTELEGMGLSLQAYSERLRKLAHSLDLMCIKLESLQPREDEAQGGKRP